MELFVDIEKQVGGFCLRSSFSIESGRLALLGPSGCGKTMTLKCIAGIEKPDKGTIRLGDRVLYDSDKKINVPSRDRHAGFLFQNYALFPNMTVRENVLVASHDKRYALDLIERFQLVDIEDLLPNSLSGGQSQRTALARMLAAKPEILMFDEPFSALDNYLAMRMERELQKILENFEGPSILVTHDRNEAYRMADKIAAMESGCIVEIKERHDFFDNPDTVTAARLTGCKNISGISKNEDGSYFAQDWGIRLEPCTDGNGLGLDSADSVGYRAHYFKFVSESTGQNCFDCELLRVVEDTFSVSVLFRQRGNDAASDDSVLTWIVNKDEWIKIKDDVMSGTFLLSIDPQKLMPLRNSKDG
ncbi:MAG: ATP-binding cassette domain-containing protein [Lachnospiraceae bacterium]|nr:ATP-binding cassette domain-containing protein [Lachnospiraceae bacterium]